MKTPKLVFTNIPNDGIIEKRIYKFNVKYSQEVDEPISGIVFYLYDEFGKEITSQFYSSNAENIYSHTFNGFDDNTIYKIEARVSTVNGLEQSTGVQKFEVRLLYPQNYNLLDTLSDCKLNCVRVHSNIVMADGYINPRYMEKYTPFLASEDIDHCIEWEKQYLYDDVNDEVINRISDWSSLILDVHEQDNYVEWTDGYSVKSDFAFTLFMKDGVLGKFIEIGEPPINGYTASVIRGIPIGLTIPKDVLELRGYCDGELKVVKRSNYVDLINQLSYYMIGIKKQGDEYELKFDVIQRGTSKFEWSQQVDDNNYIMWDERFHIDDVYRTRNLFNMDNIRNELFHPTMNYYGDDKFLSINKMFTENNLVNAIEVKSNLDSDMIFPIYDRDIELYFEDKSVYRCQRDRNFGGLNSYWDISYQDYIKLLNFQFPITLSTQYMDGSIEEAYIYSENVDIDKMQITLPSGYEIIDIKDFKQQMFNYIYDYDDYGNTIGVRMKLDYVDIKNHYDFQFYTDEYNYNLFINHNTNAEIYAKKMVYIIEQI